MAERIVNPADASDIHCPTCGTPIYGFQLDDGTAWVRCDGKREREGRHERCNQWLHILGTGRGVSFVLAVTPEEVARYRPQQLGPLRLYEELGVVIRLRSGIPSVPRRRRARQPAVLNLSRVEPDGTPITHFHFPLTGTDDE